MGKAKDLLSLTQSGVLDIGYVGPSYVSDKLPLFSVGELPELNGWPKVETHSQPSLPPLIQNRQSANSTVSCAEDVATEMLPAGMKRRWISRSRAMV